MPRHDGINLACHDLYIRVPTISRRSNRNGRVFQLKLFLQSTNINRVLSILPAVCVAAENLGGQIHLGCGGGRRKLRTPKNQHLADCSSVGFSLQLYEHIVLPYADSVQHVRQSRMPASKNKLQVVGGVVLGDHVCTTQL